MMGRQDRDQRQLFYEFSLDEMIPADHLLRRINVFATAVLADLHEQLKAFYSDIGRPSVDPELMIRMLLVLYCYGIRHERRLCQEVALQLSYRWFCKLDLDDKVPHHSTFSVYGLNYPIDVEHAIIVDVEPRPARTCDEVASTRTMLERTEQRLGIKPDWLAADTAYGTGKLLAWLLGKNITPHIPVWERYPSPDGMFSRSDFTYDAERDIYVCPNGRLLRTSGTVSDGRVRNYLSQPQDCRACALKQRCTRAPFKKIARDINEDARNTCPFTEGHAGVRAIEQCTQKSRDAFCTPEGPARLRAYAPSRSHRRATSFTSPPLCRTSRQWRCVYAARQQIECVRRLRKRLGRSVLVFADRRQRPAWNRPKSPPNSNANYTRRPACPPSRQHSAPRPSPSSRCSTTP